jgi:signal peptidase I
MSQQQSPPPATTPPPPPVPPSKRHAFSKFRSHPVIDTAITLVIALAIAYATQLWIVKPYRVPSPSMETTLHVGDRILAARFLYRFTDPARDEILVFHPNGFGDSAERVDHVASVTFVKRLIGLPGEYVGAVNGKVWICKDKAPATDQAPTRTAGCRFLNEPYISSPQEAFGPVHVPKGQYFMMGDNRSNSDDSRIWGTIKRSQILGRVFATYWPPTRISVY